MCVTKINVEFSANSLHKNQRCNDDIRAELYILSINEEIEDRKQWWMENI